MKFKTAERSLKLDGIHRKESTLRMENLAYIQDKDDSDFCVKSSQSFDPANQVTLSWHKINAFTKQIKGSIFSREKSTSVAPKHILKNVSGEVKFGQLLAIMGASGAGKTTLMNVLTSRNLRRLDVTGDVLINGQSDRSSITRMSAYVQQDDLFIGTLTVKEHLIFQAMLQMDKKYSYKEREKRVTEVISELGLSKCANTMIGIPGTVKGISGGERKRLAFAAEVLTNPALMFCDEPTSGLDSFTSQSVVSVLRNMAEGGRTIICTIHQPSSEVYAMFHYLLLMAEGRVAYLGEAAGAIDFFSRLNIMCPVNFNPADFFIHYLAIVPGKEETCRKNVNNICDAFAIETGSQKIIDGNYSTKPIIPKNGKGSKGSSLYKASWFMQMRAVTWRCFLSTRREPQLTKVRFTQCLLIATVLGLVFWQQEVDQKGIGNLNGALFIILMNQSYQNVFAVVNVFCQELPIFLREHWNGMYRVDVYFLCKTLSELPVFIVMPALFTTIIYWMAGLNPDPISYIVCVVVVVLVANTASSFGYFCSSISSSTNVAIVISSSLTVPPMLFGGFFLNSGSVPIYFIWIKYLSWFYYGNEALLVNQWSNIGNIICERNISCILDGKTVLETLNFKEDNFFFDIWLLLMLFVFFRVLAFMIILLKANRRT